MTERLEEGLLLRLGCTEPLRHGIAPGASYKLAVLGLAVTLLRHSMEEASYGKRGGRGLCVEYGPHRSVVGALARACEAYESRKHVEGALVCLERCEPRPDRVERPVIQRSDGNLIACSLRDPSTISRQRRLLRAPTRS